MIFRGVEGFLPLLFVWKPKVFGKNLAWFLSRASGQTKQRRCCKASGAQPQRNHRLGSNRENLIEFNDFLNPMA